MEDVKTVPEPLINNTIRSNVFRLCTDLPNGDVR